jgi:hypothetical protein
MPAPPGDEVMQWIRENWLNLNLEAAPVHIRRYFTDNFFMRAFAYLVGRGETSAIPIEATEDGRLKVVTLPGGFTHNDSTTDTSTDANQTFQLADICGRVDVWVYTNDITIARRPTAVAAFEDDVELDTNQFYSFDCDTEAVRYKSTTPGSHGTIQIVGWY